MTAHLLLAFGKDDAGVTLALLFVLGMAVWGVVSLFGARRSGDWR